MIDGISKTRLYAIFSGMKQRCYNPNSPKYKWYGGKGISICDEWMGENGLSAFIEWSLNNGYEEHLTIDRIDSNGSYSPENCRWITGAANSSRANNTKIQEIEEIAEFNSVQILKKHGYKVIHSGEAYLIYPPGCRSPIFYLLYPETIMWVATILSDTMEMAVEGHKAPVQAQADTVGYLSPGTLEAAQRATEATGEALEQFVERAVETQAKRDMTSLRLGINPATGERLVKAPERPQESD